MPQFKPLPNIVVVPHKWLVGLRMFSSKRLDFEVSGLGGGKLTVMSSKALHLLPRRLKQSNDSSSNDTTIIFSLLPVSSFYGESMLKFGDVVFVSMQAFLSRDMHKGSLIAVHHCLHKAAADSMTSRVSPGFRVGNALLIRTAADLLASRHLARGLVCVASANSLPIGVDVGAGRRILYATLGIVSSTVKLRRSGPDSHAKKPWLSYSPFSLTLQDLSSAVERACGFAALIAGHLQSSLTLLLPNVFSHNIEKN